MISMKSGSEGVFRRKWGEILSDWREKEAVKLSARSERCRNGISKNFEIWKIFPDAQSKLPHTPPVAESLDFLHRKQTLTFALVWHQIVLFLLCRKADTYDCCGTCFCHPKIVSIRTSDCANIFRLLDSFFILTRLFELLNSCVDLCERKYSHAVTIKRF